MTGVISRCRKSAVATLILYTIILLTGNSLSLACQSGKEDTPENSDLAAAELAAETAFWNSIKDSVDTEPFRLYLKKYPEGKFAELAKYKLSASKGASDNEKNTIRVVIYRGDTRYKPSIFVNGIEICRLEGKRFVEFLLPSGNYTFNSGKDKQVELELKPGEQRFLRVWYGVRNYQIKEVSSEQAQEEMKRLVHNSPKFIFHKGYVQGKLLNLSTSGK